jgi:hypothetical protein
MLFVVKKREFQHAISIVRDDRTRRTQRADGPYLRIQASDDTLSIEGLEASAQIPATVYEPGVLFLRVTLFRRLLQTIKGDEFLTIQVDGEDLIVDQIRLSVLDSEIQLYVNPATAPTIHPDDEMTRRAKTPPTETQRGLWDDSSE